MNVQSQRFIKAFQWAIITWTICIDLATVSAFFIIYVYVSFGILVTLGRTIICLAFKLFSAKLTYLQSVYDKISVYNYYLPKMEIIQFKLLKKYDSIMHNIFDKRSIIHDLDFEIIFELSSSIRFVGVCNMQGQLLDAQYRNGITPMLNDSGLQFSVMRTAIRSATRTGAEGLKQSLKL